METIEFYGATLFVVRDPQGVGWVAIKPICDAIGINYPNQYVKLTRDTRFNCCGITMVAEDGRQREMACLPVSKLNAWLYGINANKVKPEVRDSLERYQQECQDVLCKHFMSDVGGQELLIRLLAEFREDRALLREVLTKLIELHAQSDARITALAQDMQQRITALEEARLAVVDSASLWGKGLQLQNKTKGFRKN